ncbi:MAG: Asp-tRNA(Asn)/Glu-tRNA(Gln) amidotransferase subunit GatC [Candidatus Kaiserbacteria bacterium]|nr:Asp-tRNA(Asn)/Glu-tRNA(Gln) amidotransferase subunit GatC [Candidatus Kaiserbacteria bacterium]MCB9816820.1 Asp-tRNA(Asn)/Glu-tRNA(Gln) amidotransferase subunit GatC [Candidatus Nomurabacteria bacterium]
MKREDIEHLASLARIRLTEEEMERLPGELSSIVAYVSVVSDIAGEEADAAPEVGVRYNVFRKDEVTNEPDQYTKDILAEMPKTEGRFMKVKKILQVDE